MHLLQIFLSNQASVFFFEYCLFSEFKIQNTLQNSDWMPPVVMKLKSTKPPLYKIIYNSSKYNQKSVQRYCKLDPRCDIHGTKTMQAPPTKLFKLILPFLMRNAIVDTCRDSLPFGSRCSNFIDYTKVLSFDPDQIYFFLINKSELDRIYPTILNAIISYLRNFQFLILNFFLNS